MSSSVQSFRFGAFLSTGVCHWHSTNLPLRFLGDVSGRWMCVNSLVGPARVVSPDFVSTDWQGPNVPVMMGGHAGPWKDYSHACVVVNNKVFLAGVFQVGAHSAVNNAVGMLDLPLARTSAWLTPAIIAIIASSVAVHVINILAVAVFVRRCQWRAGSHRLLCLWVSAAVVFSGFRWILALLSHVKFPSSHFTSLPFHRTPLSARSRNVAAAADVLSPRLRSQPAAAGQANDARP